MICLGAFRSGIGIPRINSDRKSPCSYLYRRSERTMHLLISSRQKLDGYQLSPMEPISYTTRDGMTIEGYVLPMGAP